MKTIAKATIETNFNNFKQDVLTNDEMTAVRGGTDIRPKSRDKDMWPDEDEQLIQIAIEN